MCPPGPPNSPHARLRTRDPAPARPAVTTPRTPASGREQAWSGVLYAGGAFGIWGVVPVYFKAVAAAGALEVLAHRVVWSVVLMGALLTGRRRLGALAAEFRAPGRLRLYLASTALVSVNWLVFIWAVQNGRVLEASLGYYINPLVNVLLGMVFLHERLSRLQGVAVALATVGVAIQVAGVGELPWVALALAFSFGLYGLVRKRGGADPLLGLMVETLFLLPAALALLAVMMARGSAAFGRGDLGMDALLVFSGVVTAVPLVLFLEAAQRLRLATLGLMQYIAPTLHFLLAVLVYDERFTVAHLLAFALIWAALALYSFDAYSALRRTPHSREELRGEKTG